jgi:flagellin
MRIQHNIMAMNAYRNYNTNTSALSKNLEKLSSGYKINRAGDDAAGLAISEKMRAQITGLNAAQKNVKDGISLVKTAEGAMQEIQDMLNRMDYLATQSANGTYDNEVDRYNLQKEVNQLKDEINRIADSANFNGIKLLDGSLAADTSGSTMTELSGIGKTDGVFSIVADGQLGVKPVAGEFTYDLSQLEITVNVDAAGNITIPQGNGRAAGANYAVTFAATSGATGTTGGGTTGTTGGGGTTGTTGGGTTGGGATTGAGPGKLQLNIGGIDIELDVRSLLKTDPTTGDYIAGPVTLTGKDLAGQIAQKLNAEVQAKYSAGGTTGGGGTTGTTGGGGTTGTTGGTGASTIATHNAGIATAADNTVTMGFLDENGKLAGSEVEITLDGDSTLKITMKTPPTEWNHDIDMTLRFSDGTNYNGGEQFAPTVVVEPVDSSTTRMYAQAKVDLNQMGLKDGSTLKIGDTTYTFAVGPDSKFKNGSNVVNLTDVAAGNPDLAKIAANRLTQVAKNNRQFIVGSTTEGVVSLTEKEGAIDYAKNNLAGVNGKGTQGTEQNLNGTAAAADSTLNDWAGLVSYGTASTVKGGLTLQIGDTSDDFNQMSVTVGDMHTKGMGIADVDISTQAGAADSVQTIKDAINYVSGIRGDLGAVQNRLEHTGNNLSVMAENIQDAESTIRDTDVAEEMMSYVKNNILVQSAQAMLAQANQVPQGVLQLLG